MSLLDSYYDDNIVRFYDYKEFLPFCALTCQDYVTMDCNDGFKTGFGIQGYDSYYTH